MAHAASHKVGICDQAPSDYPEFVTFLVEAGIDSVSLNPKSVITVKQDVANAEKKTGSERLAPMLRADVGDSRFARSFVLTGLLITRYCFVGACYA